MEHVLDDKSKVLECEVDMVLVDRDQLSSEGCSHSSMDLEECSPHFDISCFLEDHPP